MSPVRRFETHKTTKMSHAQSFMMPGTARVLRSISSLLLLYVIPQHTCHCLHHSVVLGSTAVWLPLGPFQPRKYFIRIDSFSRNQIEFAPDWLKKESPRRYFQFGGREVRPNRLEEVPKDKRTFRSNRSNRIEFEELIQRDMACSHWANVPEPVRRLFGFRRRPRPRR